MNYDIQMVGSAFVPYVHGYTCIKQLMHSAMESDYIVENIGGVSFSCVVAKFCPQKAIR